MTSTFACLRPAVRSTLPPYEYGGADRIHHPAPLTLPFPRDFQSTTSTPGAACRSEAVIGTSRLASPPVTTILKGERWTAGEPKNGHVRPHPVKAKALPAAHARRERRESGPGTLPATSDTPSAADQNSRGSQWDCLEWTPVPAGGVLPTGGMATVTLPVSRSCRGGGRRWTPPFGTPPSGRG